ncbi:MAG: hypothetical protein IPJ61_19030 [Tessaracoccus sp.]|uniref:hypothetical protein n=1 Tax=Tessaracoccus sp. TaxID=1971211 RepID=UPI001EBD7235|nr:hypothetical protein [Tessaracoccus sp.]MBK7823081.1 hypothetical protein [Tessaracoccus sp.]
MPAFAVALFFVLTPLLVAATGSTDPLSDLVAAARSGDGRVIAAALLVLVMTALRDFRGNLKWFSGDRGGVLFLFLMSFLGALVTSFVTRAPIDATLAISALQIGVLAAGGYTAVKRLMAPKDATAAGEITPSPVEPLAPVLEPDAEAPTPPKDAA